MSEGGSRRRRNESGLGLDDPSLLARLDQHRVREVLAAFPQQCREALSLRMSARPALSTPRAVIVAGMGGSAAGGDLLAACAADHLRVPLLVHRSYGLPVAASDTLVIASSYSGETVETLSAAETALAREHALVVVTTGGALGRLAERRGVSAVTLPGGLMPRMALGYLFFPLLGVLAEVGLPLASPDEVAEALDVVEALARELGPAQPVEGNEAKRLALAIGTRIPALYGGPATHAAVYRWKTDFAENAKLFALTGVVPEMNHNEIEAWQGPRAREVQAVFLRDDEEPPAIARRFAVLRDLIEPGAGRAVLEAWTRGKGRLARLISLAYLGQWTSYYLAMLGGRDPWPIPLLDALKRRLAP
ncbi:MAG: bifunctional phosphoglucose/phosphomannose isomerase [Candidatus Rokuibacteriota bacterium]